MRHIRICVQLGFNLFIGIKLERPRMRIMKPALRAVLVLLFLSLHGVTVAFPQNQNQVEELKARLSKARGKEKIKVLLDLAKAVDTNAPPR